MGKTKPKSKTKKITQKAKSAGKARNKTSKAPKAAAKKAQSPKKNISTAAKAKASSPSKSKSQPKVIPTSIKAKSDSKKAKVSKKDLKNQKEELELFDDEDITESEELLEYQEDLELSETDEEDEVQEEPDGAEDSEESDAQEGDGLAATASTEEDEDFYLTDAEGNRYCRAKDCDQIAIVDGYCRYHYLLYWKRIQVRKEILQDGKLERYIEDLTSRYPDKFLDMLRKDLRTTKDFMAAIAELEIDESSGENEFEEDTQTYIDEVRGLSDAASSSLEEDEY